MLLELGGARPLRIFATIRAHTTRRRRGLVVRHWSRKMGDLYRFHSTESYSEPCDSLLSLPCRLTLNI
jgi:hypothetical protein